MADQPEALRLADALGLNYAHLTAVPEINQQAAAELRRLHRFELANNLWHEKTDWVQETVQPRELGMHRADVLKQRIERLESINLKLAGAIDMIRETLNGGNVDDLLYIINTALAEHRGNHG
jgi:hypothetical protein